MPLSDALRDAAAMLEPVSETARLDAELLAAHALGLERMEMLARMRDLHAPDGFAEMVARRLADEPVAYITGRQAFWDIELSVTPDVLIPRSDSETLIAAAQAYFAGNPPLSFRGGDRGVEAINPEQVSLHAPIPNPSHEGEGLCAAPRTILDLGTGSGALLLAALSQFPGARGIGIDASEAALEVARGNADKLGMAERAEIRRLSWHDTGWAEHLKDTDSAEPVEARLSGEAPFDLILCNPPYVEEGAALAPMVADHEPHDALFAGADGLSDYRVIIPAIPALLADGGVALFEIGHEQAEAVSKLAVDSGLLASLHHDLSGKPRCVAMTGA